MRVPEMKALAYESPESSIPETIPVTVNVFIAHLVYHDAHYKFWFSARLCFVNDRA
jgi:hypothetical protein